MMIHEGPNNYVSDYLLMDFQINFNKMIDCWLQCLSKQLLKCQF